MIGDEPVEALAAYIHHPRLGADADREGDRDRHDFHEIVYVERGSYRARVAGGVLPVPAGSLVFYPAGCRHRGETPQDLRPRLWLLRWRGWTPGWTGPFVQADTGLRVLGTLAWLASRQHADDAHAPALRHHLTVAVLHEIASVQEGTAPQADPVAAARVMLDTGLDIPWTLAELAAHVGLTADRLARRFAAAYGEGPISYLTRRRVEAAVTRLRASQDSLAAIAPAVGYRKAGTLARAIRRVTGRSVRELRRGGTAGTAT